MCHVAYERLSTNGGFGPRIRALHCLSASSNRRRESRSQSMTVPESTEVFLGRCVEHGWPMADKAEGLDGFSD